MKMTMGNQRWARRHLAAGLALLAAAVSVACVTPRGPISASRPPQRAADALRVPAAPLASAAVPPVGAPADPAAADAGVELEAPPAPETGQPAEVARRPFPRRIERWRGLVREVMAEESQAGTLDGPAQRLDEDVVLAVIQQESQGNARALSPAGAIGLMQVMPGTFALVMASGAAPAAEVDPDSLWDERTNVRAGVRYLALAMQQQEGNLYWSLASYNAGINAARRWRLAGLYAVPPIGGYAETADYAQVILRNYLGHRPGLEMYVPDPMPPEHVAGAMQLLREFRRRGA